MFLHGAFSLTLEFVLTTKIISSCVIDRVKNGSLLVHGKIGSLEPLYLVMPIAEEPFKPRMWHNERSLTLWVKDSPFSLDYITNLTRNAGLDLFQPKMLKVVMITFLFTHRVEPLYKQLEDFLSSLPSSKNL